MTAAAVVVSIEIYASWCGLADPPRHAAQLCIDRSDDGRYLGVDQLTTESHIIDTDTVDAVLSELDCDTPELDASLFPVTQRVLKTHYGSLATDDSPQLLVRLHFADETEVCCYSNSQHAFLLPFTIQTTSGKRVNFNPRLSKTIARLMPPEFLLRSRLLQGKQLLLDAQESDAWLHREDTPDNNIPTLSQEEARERLEQLIAGTVSDQQRDEAERTGNLSQRLLFRTSSDVIRDVLSRGADPSFADDQGHTALMHAADPPLDRDRFRLLVEAGAHVDARRNEGETGLHIACARGEAAAAQEWVDAGANVNARTTHRTTPLMFAASRNEIVRTLLNAGAEVNAVDNDGHSALIYLIHYQSCLCVLPQLESLELLINAGVDLRNTDRDGRTPLQHADALVRQREVELEVTDQLYQAQHGQVRPRKSWAELNRERGIELDDFEKQLLDTDYDDLQVAEIIRDRIRSQLR